jgi:hypothetical protein
VGLAEKHSARYVGRALSFLPVDLWSVLPTYENEPAFGSFFLSVFLGDFARFWVFLWRILSIFLPFFAL